jgi:hypothetical protein
MHNIICKLNIGISGNECLLFFRSDKKYIYIYIYAILT